MMKDQVKANPEYLNLAGNGTITSSANSHGSSRATMAVMVLKGNDDGSGNHDNGNDDKNDNDTDVDNDNDGANDNDSSEDNDNVKFMATMIIAIP